VIIALYKSTFTIPYHTMLADRQAYRQANRHAHHSSTLSTGGGGVTKSRVLELVAFMMLWGIDPTTFNNIGRIAGPVNTIDQLSNHAHCYAELVAVSSIAKT